jgi:hypothetical protein
MIHYNPETNLIGSEPKKKRKKKPTGILKDLTEKLKWFFLKWERSIPAILIVLFDVALIVFVKGWKDVSVFWPIIIACIVNSALFLIIREAVIDWRKEGPNA